jgi:hypothetical protein
MSSKITVQLLRRVRSGTLGVLVALALLLPGQALAETLTGTFLGKGIGREVAFQHNGKAHRDWAGVLKFRLDNGPDVSVFCIQIEVRVSTGDRYRSDGPVLVLPNGCQIRYLLDKYPAATATDADEAAARQLAIWVFSDNVDPMTIQDVAIRDRVIALVSEARLGACPQLRATAPDLKLDPPAASSAAGHPIAYTLRAGAEDAGQTLSVSVAGPAQLTDSSGGGSGQQRQNVTLDSQGQATFWVTGTGAGDVTVRADLSYRLDAGTVFSQLDDSAPSQRLVLADSRVMASSAVAQAAIAAGAPPPSPTPIVEETPPPPAPQPTNRPSRPPKPTATPEQPADQPTAIAGEQATAVPSPASADTTAIPGTVPAAGGQPVSEGQPAGAAVPGGTERPIPSSLPNTGGAADPLKWAIAIGLLLVALGGWLASRRVA